MPRRVVVRLRLWVLSYLLCGWATSTYALASAPPDLLALPWLQSLVGVAVSWLGGLAATLNRMVAADYEDRAFNARAEFARDGAVSAVIGLSGYWGGMSSALSPAALAVVLLLGGYAGTRTLSTWVDRVIGPKP